MKANELRMGNKVGFYRSSIIEMQIGTVAEISLQENSAEYNFTIPEFNPNVYLTGGALIPIPITEEWLLKFGFVKQNLVYIIRNNILCVESKLYWDFGYYMETKTRIKYVHQLQNLVYALTGEELTIKSGLSTEWIDGKPNSANL